MHWGRPSYSSDRREERILKNDENAFVKTMVNISEWIYDLGPNRITKSLIFENGELKEIAGDKYGMLPHIYKMFSRCDNSKPSHLSYLASS